MLVYLAFPPEHWRQIWNTNPLERLNKEVKRRSDVVGIFPNDATVIRLAGAILSEQHAERQAGRRSFSIESLARLIPSSEEPAPPLLAPVERETRDGAAADVPT